MITTLEKCQLCGGSRLIGLDLKDKNDAHLAEVPGSDRIGWSLCSQCSFIFQNPRQSQEEQEDLYGESGYRKSGLTPIPEGYIRYSPHQLARFIYWLAMCGIDLREVRNWNCLDFGCGIGGALHFLGDQGNNVYGVELDRALGDFGNANYKVKIKRRVEELPRDLDFDMIFNHHSLEHVYDPNEFFEFAAKRLKPGGVLINVIPTWRYSNTSESLREFNSFHNCMYDHISFAGFMNKHGFFMESHLYHNQAQDGDWELCAIGRKSAKKNYFSWNVEEVMTELFTHIPKREAERAGNFQGSENVAVVNGRA